MTKKDFYQYDYHTLARQKENQDFYALLNADQSIFSLIQPIMETLVQTLINDPGTLTAPPMPTQTGELNLVLKAKLESHPFFEVLRVDPVRDALFSEAYQSLVRKLFLKDGYNHENHSLNRLISHWLEERFAFFLASQPGILSPGILGQIMDKARYLYEYYFPLINYIPGTWIDAYPEQWTQAADNTSELVESVRTFDSSYFNAFERTLAVPDLTSKVKYLQEVAQASDYGMLNEHYSFKFHVLMKHRPALSLMLWDKLRLPVLQDMALVAVYDAEQFPVFARSIVAQKEHLVSDGEMLSLILLQNLFENFIRISERLSSYATDANNPDRAHADPVLLSEGAAVLAQWPSDRLRISEEVLMALEPVLSKPLAEEFVFTYRERAEQNNHYSKNYNEIVLLLRSAYQKIYVKDAPVSLDEIPVNFNLQKFHFLAGRIEATENFDPAVIDALITAFINHLHTNEFYWDRSLNKDDYGTMHSFAFILSKSTEAIGQAKKILRDHRMVHEGWKTAAVDYRPVNREAYLYCSVVLLAAYPDLFPVTTQRDDFCRYMSALLIDQLRFSIGRYDDTYMVPLYLLYEVIAQKLPGFKEEYEQSLIAGIDSLKTLLTLLTLSDIKPDPLAKKLLIERLNNELQYAKRKQRQNDGFYEKAVEKLAIELL